MTLEQLKNLATAGEMLLIEQVEKLVTQESDKELEVLKSICDQFERENIRLRTKLYFATTKTTPTQNDLIAFGYPPQNDLEPFEDWIERVNREFQFKGLVHRIHPHFTGA